MTGLLIKDLKLLKVQRNFFLMFVAIAVWMQTFMDGVSFIIGYMTFCGSMAVLNTISYDEYDNGNAFLFSVRFISLSFHLLSVLCPFRILCIHFMFRG